jgi:phospholipid/cholesterol/gamma-HCH transport system substrate-binding protein
MKLKNETKVGLLIVVTLGLAIMGFRFLVGRRNFDNAPRVYAVFNSVGSLTSTNEVKINGLSVGTIDKVEETDKNLSGIKVTIRLTRDVNIPSNSIASISSSMGGLGVAFLNIEKGNSTTWLRNGDTLQTGINAPGYLHIDNGKQIVRDVIDAIMENRQKQQSKTRDSLP